MKSEYQNNSAFDFFFFKTDCRHQKCYSFKKSVALRCLDSVTVILTAPSLQMYVMSRAVTEQIVTQSRGLVEISPVQCFKVAKIDPVSPF